MSAPAQVFNANFPQWNTGTAAANTVPVSGGPGVASSWTKVTGAMLDPSAGFGILYCADVPTAEATSIAGLPDEALMRVQSLDRFYVLRTSGLNAHGEALAADHYDVLATPTSGKWEAT